MVVSNGQEFQFHCFESRGTDELQNGCMFSMCNMLGCLWLYLTLIEVFVGGASSELPRTLPTSLEAKSKYKKKKRRTKSKVPSSGASDDGNSSLDGSKSLSEVKIPTLDDLVQNFIAVLSIGLPLTLHENHLRARIVTIFISDSPELALSWKVEKGLESNITHVKLTDILYVHGGLPANCPLRKTTKVNKLNEEVFFRLVTQTNAYLFECTNKNERNAFVNGFDLLLNHAQRQQIDIDPDFSLSDHVY